MNCSDLILVNIIRQLRLSELIECHDHQSHENIHKEEGKHHKVYNVIYGHLSSEPRKRTLILVRGGHGIL